MLDGPLVFGPKSKGISGIFWATTRATARVALGPGPPLVGRRLRASVECESARGRLNCFVGWAVSQNRANTCPTHVSIFLRVRTVSTPYPYRTRDTWPPKRVRITECVSRHCCTTKHIAYEFVHFVFLIITKVQLWNYCSSNGKRKKVCWSHFSWNHFAPCL